jgi:hypothetical protein
MLDGVQTMLVDQIEGSSGSRTSPITPPGDNPFYSSATHRRAVSHARPFGLTRLTAPPAPAASSRPSTCPPRHPCWCSSFGAATAAWQPGRVQDGSETGAPGRGVASVRRRVGVEFGRRRPRAADCVST